MLGKDGYVARVTYYFAFINFLLVYFRHLYTYALLLPWTHLTISFTKRPATSRRNLEISYTSPPSLTYLPACCQTVYTVRIFRMQNLLILQTGST